MARLLHRAAAVQQPHPRAVLVELRTAPAKLASTRQTKRITTPPTPPRWMTAATRQRRDLGVAEVQLLGSRGATQRAPATSSSKWKLRVARDQR